LRREQDNWQKSEGGGDEIKTEISEEMDSDIEKQFSVYQSIDEEQQDKVELI